MSLVHRDPDGSTVLPDDHCDEELAPGELDALYEGPLADEDDNLLQPAAVLP